MVEFDLKIGDQSENGQVTIIDDDRLCYVVRSCSKGAVGLRTISKELLYEFYNLLLKYPDITSNEAREILSGKSEIDKFEYGYASTLLQMAKMIKGVKKTNENKFLFKPCQMIYYGAPGTGKSYGIKKELEGVSKDNIFRTTFHPDSDYATFVGAYKPAMKEFVERLYSVDELVERLKELKIITTYSIQKFGARYWSSLKKLSPIDRKKILIESGVSEGNAVEVEKGMAIGEDLLTKANDSQIVYKFVPQVFLLAYMQAYRKPEERVYLIIEEINRGNCAQIFGDLFQLLDRDVYGVSEYPIKADADLKSFLEGEFGEGSDAIKNGELCLPSNLYIYATMNTSDQSLFPIDSAFKRRWDWEYEPIKYKNTDWVIDIQGVKYSWVSFQREINNRILEATRSEDKMLGDFFVNPQGGVITENILLNKILFYLWNDVCKDGEGDIFRIKKENEEIEITFSDFFVGESSQTLINWMAFLNVASIGVEDDEINYVDDNSSMSKTYYINGVKIKKTDLAKNVFYEYVKTNPQQSIDEVMWAWEEIRKKANDNRNRDTTQSIRYILTNADGYKTYVEQSTNKERAERRWFKVAYNGTDLYVWNNWGDKTEKNLGNIESFVNEVVKNWHIDIKVE